MLHRSVARVSLLAVSFAGLSIAAAACRNAERAEAPDTSILGEWRSPSTGAQLSFSPSGLYSLVVKGQARPVMGAFTFDPKEKALTLQTRRESPLCADDVGSYTVLVGPMTLDPKPVRDTCDARRAILSAPFERVGRAPAVAK